MNLLTMEQIEKTYTDRCLLQDASFSIQEEEKIGVIGVNGMGKSTLLKIVAGVEQPDAGTVVKGRQVTIGYLPQTPVFPEGTTMLEGALSTNEAAGKDMGKVSEAKAMLNRLGMTEYDAPVEQLSGGQKKRIALVSVLLNRADILILDEPTNHLDNAMNEWLETYLIGFRGALLMVTHDRYFLDRVSTRIVEVDQGQIYSYPGNYSEFVRLKEARIDSEQASARKRKSILCTELAWLSRGARARSTKQKAHIQRIEEMQQIADPEADKNVQMSSLSSRMGKKTIEVQHLGKGYGGRTLLRDFSYIFLRRDRIGIIGPNGCGKSTLMKMIYGTLQSDTGTVTLGSTIRMGYFSQENEALDESMKVIDYVREVGEYVQTTEGTITAAKMLERFLFEGALQYARIEKLSGGEKRRLYLLRILMSAPNVLLLDEPTNDLDIKTLTILEDYLDQFDGIVITVSHDRYFLDRVVRRIFAFEENGHLQQYEGGYSDYLIAWEQRHPEGTGVAALGENVEERPKDDKKTAENIRNWKTREKKVKFSYKEEKEYETIDAEIATLEERQHQLEEEILANATNSAKLSELMEDKEKVEKELEEKMERWMYLSDLAEQIKNQ